MFCEPECTIHHEGKAYTSGGAYLLPCTDGKVRGAVYIVEVAGQVGIAKYYASTWEGALIAPLRSHTRYQGNFCRMARVSFDYEGRRFVGDFCPDWSQLCRVRSTTKKEA